MKKLSIEHPFFEFMGNLGDWIILNVLFVITSLPVITLGMTMTALYQVALRRVRGESRYVAREYFQACRSEWKQSTKLWLIFLITGGILLFDVLYGKNLWKMLNLAIGVLVALWSFTFTYAFPLQARFQNSTKNTLRNALFLAFRNLPATLAMTALNCIPAVCIAAGEFYTMAAMPIFCVAGFSLTAWVNSLFLSGIFQKLIHRKEDEDENTAR
ncbi:DUF624 domain-containing protein [Petralouisia muris]|uniref:DUF624 domain-containing protein n=1 Tax=Petralouisia muris TaxID=3032872 RepID=A0AC61RWK0_9FIRM|nr:DUF624 domain-containing protein [Petralouisia muris]TGY96361.1 DUF624 domain-containing protein [Petralouisia muris]